MALLNPRQKELICKIVYYGPGLGGKTTNLKYIFEHTSPMSRGELVTLNTQGDRTLYFDVLPLNLGTIKGYKIRFQLYTVPGQVFYSESRKIILRGVDGVVFVADSQQERMDANIESLEDLQENLRQYDYSFANLPYVLQLNKRDLPNIVPAEEMKKILVLKGEPVVEAVAIRGIGVMETLKEVSKLVLLKLKKEMK
ncbi:MAG: GTPase domain-containing protein [Candidatus Aminicenantes bacterium]|nr:GTPase domain-containing protein [Candidatus Aminicenantes bacterium]